MKSPSPLDSIEITTNWHTPPWHPLQSTNQLPPGREWPSQPLYNSHHSSVHTQQSTTYSGVTNLSLFRPPQNCRRPKKNPDPIPPPFAPPPSPKEWLLAGPACHHTLEWLWRAIHLLRAWMLAPLISFATSMGTRTAGKLFGGRVSVMT